MVTAIKTIPPMELYEFSPEAQFADFDTLFEEAGSERRESLLPGELEFSDQDDFGLEGPSVIKVAPPSDFDLIGDKYSDQPSLDSSIQSSLPEVTPEQLLYLQLLSN